ncbi:hypothetical protein Q5P01_017379 [Channa striata]|uniref:Uncharacterized protein n=1 Tax=Channa striata TaxID=64152 RepID=A0AA88M9E5_CHASR|nr:hypothetical protein Q5P01_017379 [Channa striata]
MNNCYRNCFVVFRLQWTPTGLTIPSPATTSKRQHTNEKETTVAEITVTTNTSDQTTISISLGQIFGKTLLPVRA